VIPQDELDRFALVKGQAESISREGFPELGYSVLQQGYRRLNELSGPWMLELESLWREALRDHCELFSIVEPALAG
jgi:hypothetical protein